MSHSPSSGSEENAASKTNGESARELLIRHAKSKKNGFFPAKPSHHASIINPLCGDQVELRILVETQGGVAKIAAVGFSAKACAICTAASSLLCECLAGITEADALKMVELFENALTGSHQTPWPMELSPLFAFEHLRVNPSRRACAVLPWAALRKAFTDA